LDIIEIDAASNTGVGMIREVLGDSIYFAPSQLQKKVYIIDECHMLSTQANNAILKTLEEPPDHAIIILVTTEEHKLLDTIKSRCQQHQFRRVSVLEIVKLLQMICDKEGFKADPLALRMLAQSADGCPRDAVTLLDQMSVYDEITPELVRGVLGFGDDVKMFELLQHYQDKDLGKALDFVSSCLYGGVGFDRFIKQVMTTSHIYIQYRLGSLDETSIPDTWVAACKNLTLSAKGLPPLLSCLVDAKEAARHTPTEEIALYTYLPKIFGPAIPVEVVGAPEAITEMVTENLPPPKVRRKVDPTIERLVAMGGEMIFQSKE
jgi:DNA polymerase-3 subunit gamma/tau